MHSFIQQFFFKFGIYYVPDPGHVVVNKIDTVPASMEGNLLIGGGLGIAG